MVVAPSRDLYPFESHWATPSHGSRIHYLDEGQGPPVLMLHGNPTWSFYYRNLVLALRPSHRVIVPDHIGCGLSDKPDDRDYTYTLDRRVADVDFLLEHATVDGPIDLVVHDWGGMIGFAWATAHPERIRRIVALNTSAFRLPAAKGLPFSLLLARTLLGTVLVRGLNAFSRGANRYCVTTPMSPEVQRAYLLPYDSWRNRIAVLRFVHDIPLRSGDPAWNTVVRTEEQLARLADKPMLLCWGERDFVFDRHFLSEWEERAPHAEVHRFPNAGHYVLEDAGDDIVPLARDFLVSDPA